MLYTLKGKIASAHPYQLDKTLSVDGAAAEAKTTGEAIAAVREFAEEHHNNTSNPHKVTKEQVGLDLVDNTPDAEKPISTLQAEAIAEAKKAGTDAQTAAEAAQETADKVQQDLENTITEMRQASESFSATLEEEIKKTNDYVDSKHLAFNATLTTDWVSESGIYYQTVNIEGILATDMPHVTPVYSQNENAFAEREAWCAVSMAATDDGLIAFVCFEDKPETAINLQIEVNR